MKVKLPLSVEEQQRLCDEANPLMIPALVDALARCQDVLEGIRNGAIAVRGSKVLHEHQSQNGYVLHVVERLLGQAPAPPALPREGWVEMPAGWVYPQGEWKGQGWCVCCNNMVADHRSKYLRVVCLGDVFYVVPPDEDTAGMPTEQDRGCFPIGATCFKRHAQLRGYEAKVEK